MKTLFLVGVVVLAPAQGFAQAADVGLGTPTGHELNVSVGGYRYVEPLTQPISLHGPPSPLSAIPQSNAAAFGAPAAIARESTVRETVVSAGRDSRPSSVSQQYQELFERAMDLLKRGEFEDAVEAFKDANDKADGRS